MLELTVWQQIPIRGDAMSSNPPFRWIQYRSTNVCHTEFFISFVIGIVRHRVDIIVIQSKFITQSLTLFSEQDIPSIIGSRQDFSKLGLIRGRKLFTFYSQALLVSDRYIGILRFSSDKLNKSFYSRD